MHEFKNVYKICLAKLAVYMVRSKNVIWSIILIKSDKKWCIHLSRSLFLYFNYLVSVTAGGPESPRGHM